MSTLSLSDLSTPKRSRPSPSSQLSNRWASTIGAKDDYGSRSNQDTDAFNVSKRIDETMNQVHQLMENVNVYSKNVCLSTNDIKSPDFVSKDSYQHSPFGKQLVITDYSNYTSPRHATYSPHIRPDNPRISSTSFLSNISDDENDEDEFH